MEEMAKDTAKRLGWALIPTGMILFIMLIGYACSNKNTVQDSRQRVPSYSQQIAQAEAAQRAAEKAAADAQTAATRVDQMQKDLQTSVEKLNNAQRSADGTPLEGRSETTGVGTITEFSGDHFTFLERNGFTKRFAPLCDDQIIPAGKTMTLNYHWRAYQPGHPNTGQSACYVVDSATIQER